MILIAMIIAAAILSGILTYVEIPLLIKLKTGQNIREEGPEAHKAKAGTPSMGGLSMLVAYIIISVILAIIKASEASMIICIMLITLAYAGIGFFDDYLKIVKHQNEGLKSGQKMALQLVIGTAFAIYRFIIKNTIVYIPFLKKGVDFGFWIIPFSIFVFVAMTNAVNLTDGLDGLASSVTMNASIFLGILCYTGIAITDPVSKLTTGMGQNPTAAMLALVLCGCCIGFLFFNRHPAKLFMGDTGSLALGACLSGIAMSSGYDFALPIIGLIYVIEALSVIIQVFVFKTQNGRRFFKMAPIHHHFEACGWSEVKVDAVFSIITLVMGIICLLAF